MAASTMKVNSAGQGVYWGGGGGLGILGFYPWLPRAEALLLTLFFFPAFVKHIMAS